ncbi:MAG: DUF4339 domain-containing protein [Deltaproteobacteria bacterium]|nr:DUF4339 domain-containing protein [Deltaproteobacteria bacterium]
MSASASVMPEGEKLYGKLPPDLGEWLFKEKDQVLGPVPPELLLSKLYDGHVNADTPVAQEVGQWKPLKEIWFLGAHVSRAQQRQTFSKAREEREQAAARLTRTRLSLALVTFAVFFTGSLGGARWTMIVRPWEDKTDWLTRRPEISKLPDRAPKLAAAAVPDKKPDGETATPPPVAEEKKPAAEPERGLSKWKEKPAEKKPKEKPGKVAKTEAAAGAKPPDELKTEGVKTEGVPVELSKEQMLAVFKGGVPGYKQCIAEEATRNAEMPSTITVEFVVANDGSTREFKVQEREIRDGPLSKCLGTRVAALKFPKFSGERKTFIFPFKITRK